VGCRAYGRLASHLRMLHATGKRADFRKVCPQPAQRLQLCVYTPPDCVSCIGRCRLCLQASLRVPGHTCRQSLVRLVLFSRAFTSLALFNILRFPIAMLPTVVTNLIEARVSLNRIKVFKCVPFRRPLRMSACFFLLRMHRCR
jgi:hypothetical protein